ncbi:MAG TPA: hypothetical protein D7H90_00425 [Candidatus Poseidoniales archaeon]|nr:MAG TPA: hypothetical protein D7H90_00425 [Candidatus Poseidoniales archaeon]HII55989.1 hypothetical protein [Candidatus Poseidoniaceae archaeon]
MEGEAQRTRSIATLFVCVVLLSILPVTHAEEPLDAFVVDGRIQMISLSEAEVYQQTMDVEEGTIISVNVGCGTCEVELEAGETILTSATSVTYKATENLSVSITIRSTSTETVSTSFLVVQDESHVNQRPSPESSMNLVDSYRCSDPIECLDMHRGNLKAITEGNYSTLGFDAGAVELNAEEYYGFTVSSGEVVELALHHASDAIRFDFYFQSDNQEVLLDNVIETMTSTNPHILGETHYLEIEEDGRIIVKVSTAAQVSSYALQRTIHQPQLTTTIDGGTSQFDQIGHGESKTAFVLGSTGIVKLAPVIEDITAQLSVRIGDNWVNMPDVLVEQNTVERIFAYPNTTMAMLTIEGAVHWVDVTIENFTDGNTSVDAPGYLPSNLLGENWPILYSEDTDGYSGELTLPTMDIVDVYLVSVEGWVDSEHRLHIQIDGTSQDLLVDVQELDQETMELLQEYTLTPDLFTNSMDLYITVGPGNHLIKLYHTNDSVLENQTWGNDLNPLEYEITITKVTTEIGEEPWFAPSDEAKFWGSTVRWILGVGMMLPALYLFYSIRKTKRQATRIGAIKRRLELLSNLLDEGKETPEQTRKSLVRSLEAVATLPWQSAIASWGEPQHSYTTDGTSIAVWNLDPRLAKSFGDWPILVGLNTEHETWEIAAFRFDAPYGQALTVERVEPRLLHQGEEVFIDSIARGTTVFLTVDLAGDATQVDVELNGHVGGTPRAMRIPTALNRFVEEE